MNNKNKILIVLTTILVGSIFWLVLSFPDAIRVLQTPELDLLKLNRFEVFRFKLPLYEMNIALFLSFVVGYLMVEVWKGK